MSLNNKSSKLLLIRAEIRYRWLDIAFVIAFYLIAAVSAPLFGGGVVVPQTLILPAFFAILAGNAYKERRDYQLSILPVQRCWIFISRQIPLLITLIVLILLFTPAIMIMFPGVSLSRIPLGLLSFSAWIIFSGSIWVVFWELNNARVANGVRLLISTLLLVGMFLALFHVAYHVDEDRMIHAVADPGSAEHNVMKSVLVSPIVPVVLIAMGLANLLTGLALFLRRESYTGKGDSLFIPLN